ncbi:MAG: hypothetical protein PW788_04890 [Micavibrio sp.]|nr:hypothetical protein [Micavibrio sp.]
MQSMQQLVFSWQQGVLQLDVVWGSPAQAERLSTASTASAASVGFFM